MIQVHPRRNLVRGRPFGKLRRIGTSHSDPDPTPKILCHWLAGQLATGLLFLVRSHSPGHAPLPVGVPHLRVSVARATLAFLIAPAAAPVSGLPSSKGSITQETPRAAVPRAIHLLRTQIED